MTGTSYLVLFRKRQGKKLDFSNITLLNLKKAPPTFELCLPINAAT